MGCKVSKWIKNCLGEAWRNGIGGYGMALKIICLTLAIIVGLLIAFILVGSLIIEVIIPHWRGISITIGAIAGFFMVPFLLCFGFSLFWSALGRPVAKGIRRIAEFAYKVTRSKKRGEATLTGEATL